MSYNEEDSNIYSFLKNQLELSEEDLERGMDYITEQGGKSYLNKLIRTSGGESKLKKVLRKELSQYKRSISSSASFKPKTKYPMEKQEPQTNPVNPTSETRSTIPSFTSDSESENKSELIHPNPGHRMGVKPKQLKKDWKGLVIRSFTWQEQMGYLLRFCSESYLHRKAKEKNLSIYEEEENNSTSPTSPSS